MAAGSGAAGGELTRPLVEPNSPISALASESSGSRGVREDGQGIGRPGSDVDHGGL